MRSVSWKTGSVAGPAGALSLQARNAGRSFAHSVKSPRAGAPGVPLRNRGDRGVASPAVRVPSELPQRKRRRRRMSNRGRILLIAAVVLLILLFLSARGIAGFNSVEIKARRLFRLRVIISVLLITVLSAGPVLAGLNVRGGDGITATGADSVQFIDTSGITATGADGILTFGPNGITATGADGITATGADGITATGARSA